MTEKDKSLFSESVESAGQSVMPVADGKPELVDFSFFDEQPSSAPAAVLDSDSKTDMDFSFFDDPAPAFVNDTTTVENQTDSFNPFADQPEPAASSGEQNSFDNGLAFFGDIAPAASAPLPDVDAGDSGVFSFNDEHRAEGSVVSRELPQPEEGSAVGNGDAPIQPQSMLFTCVKCSAGVAVDFPEAAALRLTEKCRACSTQLAITRESSAQRAHRKTRELYCCSCSHQLGHYVYCPTCGQFCPDYFLVEDPKEAQRKAQENRSNNVRIMLANLKASLARRPAKREEEAYQSHAPKAAGSWRSNKKLLTAFAVSVVLLIVLAVGAFFYLKHKEEQQYVAVYIKAVYALHAGSESVLASMAKTSTEWNSAVASGKNYIPRPDGDTGIKLVKINSEAAKLLQQLQNTPKKYDQAYARLLAFNAECTSLQNGLATSPASLEQLNRQIETAEKSVRQKKQEMKAGFTEEIRAELELAKMRYRGLATF